MPDHVEPGQKRQDAAAAIALLLLPFLVLGRALLPGKVMSPADSLLVVYPWSALAPGFTPINRLLSDVNLMFHPWLIYAGQEISHGRFPLWNPHAFAGAPFFANPQTALLFPLNALAYVLPVRVALGLIPILKLASAGLAMYWFLRVIAVGPPAAFLGAATFMFNGSLVAWLQWSNSTPGVLLPLLLGLTERLRGSRALRGVALLAAIVAADVFAGYPHGTFFGLLCATAWALYRARGAAGGPWFLARYAGAVTLGIVLGAVQLLPFLEYMRESSVFANRALWMPALSLPTRSAVTLLMPYFYGSPTGRDFWGPWNFNEIAVSVGLIPWVVFPVALATGWRRTGTKFFLGMAAAAGAILYGAPGVDAARGVLPGMSLVIGQRFAPFLVFALSALSAAGLHGLSEALPRPGGTTEAAVKGAFVALTGAALLSVARDYAAFSQQPLNIPVPLQYVWFLVLLIVATVLVLRRLRGGDGVPRWWLGLAAVQMLSLFPLAASYNPIIDARWLYPAPPSVRYVQRESARDHGRVLLQPNVPMLYGLFEAGGYDGMTPERVEQIIGPAGLLSLTSNDSLLTGTVFRSPAMDLLGVRWIVARPDVILPDGRFALEYAGSDARVYRNDGALPRVFLVPKVRCVTDEEAVDLIWKRAVEFRDEALLAGCAQPAPAGSPGRLSRAEIRAYEPDRVVIDAVTDAPVFLVLTDTWFPGWRARVDGAEARVWRADHAFRAVRLQPGEHRIVFSYEPLSFRLGLGLSLLAACVAVVLAFPPRRWRRATLACLTLGLLVGASAGVGEAGQAALPPAPFDLSVSPATVYEGEPITIRIDRRVPSTGADRRFDLYLVVYDGWDVDSFVSPAGTRSIEPVAYRQGLSMGEFESIHGEWRDPVPLESLALGLIVVKASTSPFSRASWLYQPTLRAIRVRASLPDGPARVKAAIVLGCLAFVTLTAVLFVIVFPGRLPKRNTPGLSNGPL